MRQRFQLRAQLVIIPFVENRAPMLAMCTAATVAQQVSHPTALIALSHNHAPNASSFPISLIIPKFLYLEGHGGF